MAASITSFLYRRPRPLSIRDVLVLDRARLPHFDLQRFSAEDEGRTELPTDRRKREEREKGNVPRSQDLASSAVLLGTVVTLFFTAAWVYEQCRLVFNRYLTLDFRTIADFGPEDVKMLMMHLFSDTAKIIGPVVIAGVIMAVIGNVSQVGALFTLKKLEFKPENLIPDFKRVLPARRTIYNLLKTLVQVIVIATATYLVVVDDFIPMLRASGMGLLQALGLFGWISFKLLIICGILFVALAIPDYFYQRFEFTESLKMTLSELRREFREESGSPLIRERIRSQAEQMRRQRVQLQEVPKADVVITNPTHYAVALQYDTAKSVAPIVIAKGVDHMAFLIRSTATANNVPIEVNPPLARILYKDVEIGQPIPEHLYRVIGTIFAKLDRFRRTGAGVR
ncbi:MAG: EscU/YscU/HrcU family type III secretion system export apparatus switch protein [Spirochaetia bacterium]|nr:EscU/YscU/HrcU family type III secretion system export apparatus switch protein [Spirochaetia bacterium]